MHNISDYHLVNDVFPLEIPTLVSEVEHSADKWSYWNAFKRNRGLISEDHQDILRRSRVAIAGMGGVGAVHLVTLARLGIGNFTIADPDVFDVPNFNRQYGATVSNLGRNKAVAMAEIARDINPELNLRVFDKAIDQTNVRDFLDGANVFVDGLDFFAIGARRLVFRHAAECGLWAITAGPIGFSTAWLTFDPNGMPFDRYFDLHDEMSLLEQLIAFAVGLTPRALHLSYTDLRHVSIKHQYGPSSALACQIASGVMCAEVMRVLIDDTKPLAAPVFHQFDAYRSRYVRGTLRRGNRSARQLLKRFLLRQRLLRSSKQTKYNNLASSD